MAIATGIGQTERRAVYAVPDAELAVGSTLRGPKVATVIEASSPIERRALRLPGKRRRLKPRSIPTSSIKTTVSTTSPSMSMARPERMSPRIWSSP